MSQLSQFEIIKEEGSAKITGRGKGNGGQKSRGGSEKEMTSISSGGLHQPHQTSKMGRRCNKGLAENSHHERKSTTQTDKQNQSCKKNLVGLQRSQRYRSSSFSDKSNEYYAAKKSIDGPYAHLFCSERHRFALSRVLYPNDEIFLLPLCHNSATDGSTNRKITSDQLEKWWESVKLVRCNFVCNETNELNLSSFLDRCPICLDENMISPFIAPCGHSFCLPCVLGFFNFVSKELNAESIRIKNSNLKVKSSNQNGISGSCYRLSPPTTITTVRTRCPMCNSGSAFVLNAGESMITYKDLRPVVFTPVGAIHTSSVTNMSRDESREKKQTRIYNEGGTRMRFVKLHRVRGCPAPYLPLHGHKVRGFGASTTVSSSVIEQPLPDLPDGDDDTEECIYARQYYVGSTEYDNILECCLNDLYRYQKELSQYPLDPHGKSNVSMAIEAIQASQRRWTGSNSNDGGFRAIEMLAKRNQLESSAESKVVESVPRVPFDFETLEALDITAGKNNSCDNIESNHSYPDISVSNFDETKSDLLPPGTAFLSDPNSSSKCHGHFNECFYYQASDGQQCFLSGINVACLLNEFSLHNHSQDEKQESCINNSSILINRLRRALPLPDEITGTVIGVETQVITPSVIKRMNFLSHIPLNSSVNFVEIDWYSGGEHENKPMLTQSTLSKFRGEIKRRRSERQRIFDLEEKVDKAARAKSERNERQRQQEAFRSCYLDGVSRQSIDPNDEFFQIPSSSKGEVDGGVRWKPSPEFKFSEVCASGGVWPALSSAVKCHQPNTSGDAPICNESHVASSSEVVNSWGRDLSRLAKIKLDGNTKSTGDCSDFPSLVESSISAKTHGIVQANLQPLPSRHITKSGHFVWK